MPNLRPISTSARSANGEMLFEAQLHQLEALAKRRPVLMVFEDAHWIDPTSRELLDLTFDRVRLLPVLLIVTFRPEFRHAWGGQPQVTVLALNQLGGSDSAVLVEGLAGNAGLSREIVDEILSAPLACHCSSKSFISTSLFPSRRDRTPRPSRAAASFNRRLRDANPQRVSLTVASASLSERPILG